MTFEDGYHDMLRYTGDKEAALRLAREYIQRGVHVEYCQGVLLAGGEHAGRP